MPHPGPRMGELVFQTEQERDLEMSRKEVVARNRRFPSEATPEEQNSQGHQNDARHRETDGPSAQESGIVARREENR